MSVKGFLKTTLRILFYAFLLTLPFNFQAILAGALFAKFYNDRVATGVELFMRAADHFSWMNQWSVPGAPSIWDFQDNSYPFFTQQLRENDWSEKLGLLRPYAHQQGFVDEAPINSLMVFEGAVRDTTCGPDRRLPTEWWVYVSSVAMPEVYAWDKAFVQLLEYHEMFPLPDKTAVAYVDCAATPFLCHVWQVQYPALMHFKINESGTVGEDIDPAAFASSLEYLRPLEVRIFDFGLQLDVSPLPPGIFPSRFEQMKALTTNDGAYTLEEEYSDLMRAYRNFNEYYYFPACNRDGSFLDYTSTFDNFLLKRVAKPIGLKGVADRMNGIAFSLSLVFISPIYMVSLYAWDFFHTFFGEPTEIDRIAQRIEEREAVVQRGGIMGDMMLGGVNHVEAMYEAHAAESAEQPVVTTQNDLVKSLFDGLRANMSSIWNGV